MKKLIILLAILGLGLGFGLAACTSNNIVDDVPKLPALPDCPGGT